MSKTPVLASSSALLFLVAGCAPSLPDVDPAVDRAAIDSANMEVVTALEAEIGVYVKGDIPIYRGTARASDNASAGGEANGKLSGDVVAAIAPTADGLQLAVFAPSQTRLRVAQASATPDQSSFSLVASGSCVDCFASLATRPPSIHAASLTIRGAPLMIDAERSATIAVDELALTRLSHLTFEDIAAAKNAVEGDVGSRARFTQRGDEMIRKVGASITTGVPGNKDFHSCARIITYEAEWYVNLTSVTDYGVRNFAIVKRETCCSNEDGDDTGHFSPNACESD
jgi:hypothetical protein